MTDEPVSVDLGWLGQTWISGAFGYGLDGFCMSLFLLYMF